jgi:hypothetical protein
VISKCHWISLSRNLSRGDDRISMLREFDGMP